MMDATGAKTVICYNPLLLMRLHMVPWFMLIICGLQAGLLSVSLAGVFFQLLTFGCQEVER